jgi:hypothetical protein
MKRQIFGCVWVLLTALVLSGCAAGGMKKVEKAGFLRDYGQLKPGGEDRAALVYIKPGVDLKPYDKIIFERVTVMLSPDADYKVIDPALLKEMTDYYQNALINAVKDGYQVVGQPGPGVLWVRVAITDIKPSSRSQHDVVDSAGRLGGRRDHQGGHRRQPGNRRGSYGS